MHECRGLAAVLVGNPALFREGWEFVCPLWAGADVPPYHHASGQDGWEYTTLDVGNRWGDLALLRRSCGHDECGHEDGGGYAD